MSVVANKSPTAKAMQATSLRSVAAHVATVARRQRNGSAALLVAISGVDGSGKTYLAQLLAERLRGAGLAVALVGIDPWQNAQTLRFSALDPGTHFYRHAIRFDELFAQVVDPLVANRELHLETRGIRTDTDVWEPLVYAHRDIDVVLLEGIFLFRGDLVRRYDLRVWVECSLDAALRRALARNVERRPLDALRDDYERIYHAAQRVHFALDAPRDAADLMLDNERNLHATEPCA